MATTEISYDGSRLIPAPFVTITKNFQRSGNGEIIGSTFSIQLIGKLFAYKGSPKSDKTFWTLPDYPADESIAADARLGAIERKIEAIRELFNADGRTLSIQSADGSTPMTCNPRVINLDFNQGLWYEYIDYNISLEADKIYPVQEDNLSLITDASESWNIETDETPETLGFPRTYRLTHNVSATGKRFFNSGGTLVQEPWKNAREWVYPKLGFDSTFLTSSGVRDLPSYYGGYNHVRSENIDEQGGGYSVTETWILTSGTAIEDFNIETQKSIDTGTTQVSVQGTITGLEQRTSGLALVTSKYDNAVTRYNIASGLALTRAQSYSGYTLNIIPLQTSVGRNPVTGSINYAYTFDTRPSNIIPNSLSENISITDNFDEQVIAVIPILGRAAGPILQNINTKKETTRQLSIDVVMPTIAFGTGIVDVRTALFANRPTVQVSGIIQAADPSGQGFTSYQVGNSESWTPKTGHYTRQISWVYSV